MIFNQELKDKIEDALIHFEDAGYSFQIQYQLFCNDRSHDRHGIKLYDMLKKGTSNDEMEFGTRLFIRLQRRSIMSWKEYQWFQSELKTAISRMTNDFDNVDISQGDATDIIIKYKTWKFKNLKELVEKCKYFNTNNIFSNRFGKANNVIAYPEYHLEEGIVVYVRELHTGKDSGERFSLFNQVIKKSNEEVSVSLDRAFGEDCVIKTYEEGEAEKENPYLSQSSLSKFVVAKLKCDFIKV